MTFTDFGTKVPNDWCPLAIANGIEWVANRYKMPDERWNLYRFKGAPLSWFLWWIGWAVGKVFKPAWAFRGPSSRVSSSREI